MENTETETKRAGKSNLGDHKLLPVQGVNIA